MMSHEAEMAAPTVNPAKRREKDIKTLATGASVAFVGKLGGRGVHALGQILLARLLGPELFGLYALGWTILRLMGALIPLGLDRGVIRFATEYWRQDDSNFKSVVLQSLAYGLLSGFMAGTAIYFSAPWLETLLRSPGLTPVLRWFAFAFPFLACLKVLVATTRVSQRMQFGIYTEEIAQPVANLILVLLLYWLGWKLFGSVVAAVISFGVATVLGTYYVVRLFPELVTVRWGTAFSSKQLIAFSLPTAFAGLFTLLTTWTDRLFIAYFRPVSDVGIYQAISQSSLLFAITLAALNSIFSPMIADLYQKEEMDRLRELFRVSTKWGLYLSLPLFLIICFASEEVMTVVFGSEYATGAFPLIILATGQLVNAATGSVGFMLVMTSREKQWLTISGLAFALNIALNWFLVPRLGLVGSAVATSTVISLLYLSGLLNVRWSMNLWPYDRRYSKGLIAAGLTAVTLFLMRFVIFIHSPILNLLVTAALSVGVFTGVVVLLGLDAEDQELIGLFMARLGWSRT